VIRRGLIFFFLFLLFSVTAKSQDSLRFFQSANSFHKKRTIAVVGTETILATGSLIALSQVWYEDYPQTSFHFFNDNKEWLGMDKYGHAMTAYTVGRIGINLLRWGGVERKKAIWYGGLTGFAYQTAIEFFDGYSSGWGFSTGDMLANTAGVGLLIGQEYLWQEQRITAKFGFQRSPYAPYRPELLGSKFSEELLKDYNGQTYWLSFNLASFMKEETAFPKWLNIAVGYGADGMTGGHTNPAYTFPGGSLVPFARTRQWYISPDIDLTKIPVRSHFLKAVFGTIGFLKVPLPGLMLNKGKLQGQWLSF
jgi:Predicted periplasmic lipoprotein (DUF2279)